MASAPQPQLPLFYKDLTPLNSRDHLKFHSRTLDRAPWAVGQHAIPLTVDEFPLAHRHFPIVFSIGDNPVPLALFGLNEGVSVFFDDEGKALEDFYIPAYIRRYPFMLARLDPNSETMSLCFDPLSGLVEESEDGNALFDGDQPSTTTQELMQFCENFEQAGVRTQQFMDELKKADLLMAGEVAIARQDDPDKPYVYRAPVLARHHAGHLRQAGRAGQAAGAQSRHPRDARDRLVSKRQFATQGALEQSGPRPM